jgi:type II secretory pathway component GspD/PulD (secretin)
MRMLRQGTSSRCRRTLQVLSVVLSLLLLTVSTLRPVLAETVGSGQIVHGAQPQSGEGITLTLRQANIAEVMEMLSRKARVNILLSNDVDGTISVNLYDVDLDEAIESIASAGGYAVEKRDGNYFIVDQDEAGKHAGGGPTQLRTFKVQYSSPEIILGILKNHLSNYGKITALSERGLLVVEDKPFFLNRVARLLKEIDRKPKQILIEAKILEIGLRDGESFGLDWAKLFNYDGGEGSFGIRGLSDRGSPGLFFDLVTPNIEVFLDSLRARDRLRTLSTPKLLALEDSEAEAVIGDRLGYNVTTTIDNVTTTSVEYLESGVILKVKPSVDGQGRILMEIHPEVSTGTVSDDGIPNQTTTEVTTTMLVNSGQTVFIGGLIKRSTEETREGMPVLGDLPVIGMAFSNRAINSVNTELVVLVTPYIIDEQIRQFDGRQAARVNAVQEELEEQPAKIDKVMGQVEYIGEGIKSDAEASNSNPSRPQVFFVDPYYE